MENFQDRGVRIRFVPRCWIRIRSLSDRIRNPGCIASLTLSGIYDRQIDDYLAKYEIQGVH